MMSVIKMTPAGRFHVNDTMKTKSFCVNLLKVKNQQMDTGENIMMHSLHPFPSQPSPLLNVALLNVALLNVTLLNVALLNVALLNAHKQE